MGRPKGSKNLSADVNKKSVEVIETVVALVETTNSEIGEEIIVAPEMQPMDVEENVIDAKDIIHPEKNKVVFVKEAPKEAGNWYIIVRNPDLVPSQFKRTDNNTVDVELIKAWLDADKKNVSLGVNGCLIGGGK